MDTIEASNPAVTSANAPDSEDETLGAPSSRNPASANLNPNPPTSPSPSPAAQGPTSTTVSNNTPGFRFKYPEAAPTPPGEDDVYWNRVYTAADSRMYNKHGKDANNSRKYRQNGETRTLAFQMMAEKKAKEAAGIPGRATAKPRLTQTSPMKMSSGVDSSGSRDGTPFQDTIGMSISEKIKFDGRGRKTSSAAAPSSNRATPVPTPVIASIAKTVNKRGAVAPVVKRSHKKKKVENITAAVPTPTSSARASQTPVPTAAPDIMSGDESDTSTRSGTLYCICRKPDDHSLMIECAGCEGWFHPRCMKIADEDVRDLLVDRFVCNVCTTPEFRTNFKRICRLYNINEGCRAPARVNDNPPHQPSKYCSEDHKTTFWASVWQMLREDNEPSKGGALSRGEVTALLMACPNYEHFNALGSKPKLSDVDRDPAHPLGLKFLTTNEEGVLDITQKLKTSYLERIARLKEQVKFLNMVHERAKRATLSLGKDSKTAICGYDARLAFNPDQFTEWYNSAEGKAAFKTGTLGLRSAETRLISQQVPLPDNAPPVNGIHPDFVKDMCLHPARKCKHYGWREMHNQEFTDSQKGYETKIGNLDLDIVQLIEDAETREATKAFYAENRAKLVYD